MLQVVIEIPEETYEYWQTHRIESQEYILTEAVRSGVVLPKHGRLIDADELRKQWVFGKVQKETIIEAPTVLQANEDKI